MSLMQDHAAEPAFVDGPGWSTGPGWGSGGRYPLRVELWLLRQTARLVPGVISTTPIARQYAWHCLVASEVADKKLDSVQARELLCRGEVVLAAAHASHDEHVPGVRAAHGSPKIGQLLETGLNLAAAARPGKGQYSENPWGFYGGAYRAPEVQLGLVTSADLDDPPVPGQRCDVAAVRRGLGPILEVARQSRLSRGDAVAVADELCVCRSGAFDDGRWLADVLCGADPDSALRRETIRLIAFVCKERPVTHVEYTDDVDSSLVNLLAFGKLATDAARAGMTVAGQWQGTVFRFLAVWAWRRLWARLVNELADGGGITTERLAANLADGMPAGVTVEQFRGSLPATTEAGCPVPAEWAVHDAGFSDFLTDLAELMVLAGRASELAGDSLDAYVGVGVAQYEEFGPRWLAARLEEGARLAMPDFARDLAHRLVNRAQRVAMDKGRLRRDGSLLMNSKFHVADGLARLTQPESGTALGLRLAPLASVLAGCGVLTRRDGVWHAASGWERRLA